MKKKSGKLPGTKQSGRMAAQPAVVGTKAGRKTMRATRKRK